MGPVFFRAHGHITARFPLFLQNTAENDKIELQYERELKRMDHSADHAGHRNRLRERFAREGLEGFAPHEVLELMLTFAIPRMDVNPLAHRLMDRFGSLSAVMEASVEELRQVEGVGSQAATLLAMMLPVMRLYQREKLSPRRKLGTYNELAAYCRTLFLGENHEKFYLLCFNARLELLCTSLIAEGTPTAVSYLPRKIMQELIRHNAAGAVLTHNHPSGSPLPSGEDIAVTREIQALLDGVDIRLFDHVIVAGQQDYSFFAHHGILTAEGDAPFAQASMAADRK